MALRAVIGTVVPLAIATISAVLGMGALSLGDAERPQLPPDSAYVQVRDGHLFLGDERVRFWGVHDHAVHFIDPKLGGEEREAALARSRADMDLAARRFKELGFTVFRNFQHVEPVPYTAGDGSQQDLMAYWYATLDRHDIRVWHAVLMQDTGTVTPADVDVIDDPATAEAWQAAVREMVEANGGNPVELKYNPARMWDPRLQAVAFGNLKRALQFPNHYKGGLALADDPQIAIWEQSNEEHWFMNMLGGQRWAALPEYFRAGLLKKWATFLDDKYGSEAELIKSWGFLLPGESLDSASIMLVPLRSPTKTQVAANDTNPAAIAALEALDMDYVADDFSRRRGADLIEFLVSIESAHHKKQAEMMRETGKSCRLSPMIWDTGNWFQIQLAYMQQQAGVVSTATYTKGMSHDPTYKRYPFYSALEAPPQLCWNVPWIENSKIKGCPYLVYEINIDARTKYRAEFPMLVASAASIGDWDVVCWYIDGHGYDSSKDNSFEGKLSIWHDYHQFKWDEVQKSAMMAAGEVFKNFHLAAPENPTTFIFGRKSIFDPDSMAYGKSYGDLGRRFIPTFYRYGAQVVYDPAREDDEVVGPSYSKGVYEPNPVKPTDQIEYDWSRGHLLFDAPGVAGYVGFYGKRDQPVKFDNGTRFSDVTVSNPDGIAYPVAESERYVQILLASQDDQPLDETKRAIVSAVSTSFNSSYRLDLTQGAPGLHQQGPKPGGPTEYFGAWVSDQGEAPVLVARVGVTITSPDINGMTYTFRDFSMRPIGQGIVADDTLKIPADKPVFIIELTR